MSLKAKDKKRNSSFELMRIISMFLIIIYHIIYHGKILENVNGFLEIIIRLIMALTLVHISSFVLVSGYFQHDKKMKLSKAISLNNSVWFYSIIIAVFAHFIYQVNYDKVSIFKILMPINYDQYWFIKEYLILYLITPLLNTVIQNSNQKKHKRTIIALFLITSFLPYITGGFFLNVSSGYSLYYMIFLYFVGAYLNKYPLKESNKLKKYSEKSQLKIFIGVYIGFCILNFLLYQFGTLLLNRGELQSYFGEIITNNFLSYNNPLILFASISYFLIFSCFKISSNFINRIASLMFGVYLIHENNYIKIQIYQKFGFLINGYGYRVIPKIFIVAIIILVFCSIIEYVRQLIFKFIYNLKISKINRKNYRSYIKKIGIDINW